VRHGALPRSDHLSHPRWVLLHGMRPLLRAYSLRRFGVTVHRAELVPTAGPVILAANHLGWVDGPLLALFSLRRVHVLTKAEMFVGGMDLFLRAAGAIPVDRYAADPRAMKKALRVLRDDGGVGIFPEGARGAGELDLIQRGAAYLALATGAPVVPAIFFGSREPGADSHERPSRASPVDLVFGETWQLPARPWPRRKPDVGAATEALREHLLRALYEAKTITGRELPGPLPAGDSERDAAARQATT